MCVCVPVDVPCRAFAVLLLLLLLLLSVSCAACVGRFLTCADTFTFLLANRLANRTESTMEPSELAD